MKIRHPNLVLLLLAPLAAIILPESSPACCAVYPSGKPVVNADQTVIIIWDPVTKTEHFIRQASFKGTTNEFGFLVPTPSEPELEESGNDAFTSLRTLTEPKTIRLSRPSAGMGCGCSADEATTVKSSRPVVEVLQEKRVAGFDAVVLRADTADALVDWLKENGYAFSPEVKAWAHPYVDANWRITAMKFAKPRESEVPKTVAASALRMSFKTDRPLFPYREPDPATSAPAVDAPRRLLRIYFLSDSKYAGELAPESPWTGKAAWAGAMKPDSRTRLLEQLNLPPMTGPATWWLTEFEDEWPYRVAPADLYFSRSRNQEPIEREPIREYASVPSPTDATPYALVAAMVIPKLARRRRISVGA